MLDFVILGFLFDQNVTGYEIKQMMMNSTSNFMDASFGSIYPALKKLEKNGRISFVEVVEGSRYKKRYSITEKGKEAFLIWLKTPCVFTPFNYVYLIKLFFYKHLEKNQVLQLIDSFTVTVNHELEKLKKLEDECSGYMEFFPYATLRFGKEYYEMIIKWHEQIIKDIHKKEF